MKNTTICLFYSTTNCFKNKQVLKKDQKLTEILRDSSENILIENSKENQRNLFVLQTIAKSFLDSYFNSVPMENNTYPNKMKEHKNARKELEGLEIFGNSKILISNPVFHHSTNEVQITLFYYYNDENPQVQDFVQHHYLKESKLLEVSKSLSSILFKKKVNLNLIRLRYPYMNSRILAQYLCGKTDKNKFSQLCDALVSKSSVKVGLFGTVGEEGEKYILPSYIDSIRLELSGRIGSERVVPRMTKQVYRMDSPNTNSGISLQMSNVSADSLKNKVVDYGHYTAKNHLGSFTLKVWITSLVTIYGGVSN